MWTAYKKEIIEKEEENQEFLKLYYQNSHRKHNPDSSPNVLSADEEQHEEEENDLIASNNYDEVEDSLEQDEDDWPVQVSLSFKNSFLGLLIQALFVQVPFCSPPMKKMADLFCQIIWNTKGKPVVEF